LAFDVFYVERANLCLDLRILAETLVVVLARKDVVTAPRELMLDLDEERRPGLSINGELCSRRFASGGCAPHSCGEAAE
jgi:hypothetical protein